MKEVEHLDALLPANTPGPHHRTGALRTVVALPLATAPVALGGWYATAGGGALGAVLGMGVSVLLWTLLAVRARSAARPGVKVQITSDMGRFHDDAQQALRRLGGLVAHGAATDAELMESCADLSGELMVTLEADTALTEEVGTGRVWRPSHEEPHAELMRQAESLAAALTGLVTAAEEHYLPTEARIPDPARREAVLNRAQALSESYRMVALAAEPRLRPSRSAALE